MTLLFRVGPARSAILTFYYYRKGNIISILHADLSVLRLICSYNLKQTNKKKTKQW